MIVIDSISKSYGAQILFDHAGFKINKCERVGLVGRNGHGKTTLFRILTGQEEPDQGSVLLPKNYKLGYLTQHLGFTEYNILDEASKGLSDSDQDQRWKVEKILMGLGFSMDDMKKSPDAFSGGFQVRLNLAKVLIAEPDMLLLDEPTNYLDITSIRWITKFLNEWQRELILITHDRNFMDSVVTHTIGINRKKFKKIAGNTEKFYEQISKEEEIYEKTRLNDEKQKKEMQLFISRFRAKARLANMVQSRIKTLNKMDKKEKLEEEKNLEFSFNYSKFSGKQVFSTDSITFGYDKNKPLIKDFNVSVGNGDRICIIGKNGKGKTTLLKILAGKLKSDTGDVKYNPGIHKGIYEQTNIESLVGHRTVEEEILMSHADVDRQNARNICGAMMFSGDSALKKISFLSGGEKSRVMLGKLLVTPSNLLFLDEPTNHLDMQSSDSLLTVINHFKGTVVMVTHNEMYLHAIAERLIVFKDDNVFLFEGTYQEFLEKEGWGDESEAKKPLDSEKVKKSGKKEIRRLKSAILTKKSKEISPLKKKIKETESLIQTNENLVNKLHAKIIKASESGNGGLISDLTIQTKKLEDILEDNYDILFKLNDKLDELEVKYNLEIKEIEV